MGAATSVLYAARDQGDVSVIVLDSPFSDLYTIASEVVKTMKVSPR